MDIPITKRLHISGLTPALTSADISQKLSSFGSVKELDGFDLLNGVNQPRNYGYVTIQSTAGRLAKCMSVLSGSTWRGAKLRIGEAKPDFKERLTRERDSSQSEPPKKKRRHAQGVEAADMSLVTPQNAIHRQGWKVTPLGRVIRPVKMRPLRPLPDLHEPRKMKVNVKNGEKEKKVKRRVKAPIMRARRRTIDPTRWGSVHLKGIFLDDSGVPGLGNETAGRLGTVMDRTKHGELSGDRIVGTDRGLAKAPSSSLQPRESISLTRPDCPSSPVDFSGQLCDDNIDIELEKSQSLTLLKSLFGDNEDSEWIGPQSLGSDVDQEPEREEKGGGERQLDPGAIDIVGEDTENLGVKNVQQVSKLQGRTPDLHGAPRDQPTKLKALFTPRDDTTQFSLLGHLNLDLELDTETARQESRSLPLPSDSISHPTPTAATMSSHRSRSTHTSVDPKQPLFFPLVLSSENRRGNGQTKDIYDLAKRNGWHWRDPEVGFWRTETEENIWRRWNGEKGELTRDWKRRWKEARKVRKTRGRDFD